MKGYGDHDDYQTEASGGQRLDEAALDLVLAATSGGDDGVVRALLRTLVALELTSAASCWYAAPRTDALSEWIWTQHRGFGGSTPPPSLPAGPFGSSECPSEPASASGAPLTFRLGQRGAVVALREAFDADGRREEREHQMESLILLAGTLLEDSHDYPSSHTGETEGEHGTSDPLPGRFPDNNNGRKAG